MLVRVRLVPPELLVLPELVLVLLVPPELPVQGSRELLVLLVAWLVRERVLLVPPELALLAWGFREFLVLVLLVLRA